VTIGSITGKFVDVPPALQPIVPPRGIVSLPLSFTAVASDADPGDSITYSLATVPGSPSPYPTGATIDGATGLFQWVPSEEGTYAVRVFATDRAGLLTHQDVVLNVIRLATTTSLNAPAVTYGQHGMVTVTVGAVSGTATGDVSLSVDGGVAVAHALSGGAWTFDVSV